MTKLRKYILSLVLIYFYAVASGQVNPEFHNEQVVFQETSSTITIESIFPGVQFIDQISNSPDGQLVSEWTSNEVGNNLEVTFTGGDIAEEITLIFKYFINVPNSNIPKARYINLNYSVVPSILVAGRDYITTSAQEEDVSVLENDYSSVNDFTLEHIVREQDLLASITGSNTTVIPLTSDQKMYAQYVITDSIGTNSSGVVVAVPEVSPETDIVLHHYTTNKSSLEFTLPSTGYTIDNSIGSPELITSINSFAKTYTPDTDFVGLDSISFNHINGKECLVYMHVYDKTANNGFLRDDVIYVGRNQTVVFSVLNNDLEDNLYITASSADDNDNLILLNPSGEGQFSYTPDPNYSGIQNFTYSCIYLNELQTANIKIIVSDQQPVTDNDVYNFETMANTPYVFEYPLQLSTSSLSITEQAKNGTVYILDDNESLNGECYEISGKNKIVYIPNNDFNGPDDFKIGYSPGGNLHYVLPVDIMVSPNNSSDCYCADGCVFKGDVNNDGIVDLLDLFTFGDYFGHVVTPRPSDSELWIGQTSPDNSPAKYADIDGNGVVDENDLNNFFEFINKKHSFYQPLDLISSEYSIFFEPQVETIDSGELLRINVLLGNDDFPAIEVDGLSFALNAGGTFADSASMNVVYEQNSWFCHNDPTLALTQVPYDGRIETSVVNTANTSGSGQGIVAVVEFIVEEDADDIRLGVDQNNVLSVTFDDIFVSGKDGQLYKLSPQTVEIPWKTKSQELDKHLKNPDDLILYPNPTNNFARLYLNGPEQIQDVQISTLSGQLIQSHKDIQSESFNLTMNNIPNGIYIVKVQGDKYTYTSKLSVVR